MSTNSVIKRALLLAYRRKNSRTTHSRRFSFPDGDLSSAFTLPPERAVSFLKKKGLLLSWSYKDVVPETHTKAFTVAKVLTADLLSTIHSSVVAAIESGQTLEQFKKDLTPKLEAAGWVGKKMLPDGQSVELGTPRRLETIYRTNLQSAYMNGRWAQQKEAGGLRPFIQYLAVVDSVTTDVCQSIHKKVVHINDPDFRLPPFHFNCRTRTRSLSQRQVEAMGIKISLAADEFANTPPDVSFDVHPDKEWIPDVSQYPKEIRDSLAQALKNNGTEVPKKVTKEEIRERVPIADQAAQKAHVITLLRQATSSESEGIAEALLKRWREQTPADGMGPRELTAVIRISLPPRKRLARVELLHTSDGTISILYSIVYTEPEQGRLVRGGILAEISRSGYRLSFVPIGKNGLPDKTQSIPITLFSKEEQAALLETINQNIDTFKQVYKGER